MTRREQRERDWKAMRGAAKDREDVEAINRFLA